jgi:hypothetical protein
MQRDSTLARHRGPQAERQDQQRHRGENGRGRLPTVDVHIGVVVHQHVIEQRERADQPRGNARHFGQRDETSMRMARDQQQRRAGAEKRQPDCPGHAPRFEAVGDFRAAHTSMQRRQINAEIEAEKMLRLDQQPADDEQHGERIAHQVGARQAVSGPQQRQSAQQQTQRAAEHQRRTGHDIDQLRRSYQPHHRAIDADQEAESARE